MSSGGRQFTTPRKVNVPSLPLADLRTAGIQELSIDLENADPVLSARFMDLAINGTPSDAAAVSSSANGPGSVYNYNSPKMRVDVEVSAETTNNDLLTPQLAFKSKQRSSGSKKKKKSARGRSNKIMSDDGLLVSSSDNETLQKPKPEPAPKANIEERPITCRSFICGLSKIPVMAIRYFLSLWWPAMLKYVLTSSSWLSGSLFMSIGLVCSFICEISSTCLLYTSPSPRDS